MSSIPFFRPPQHTNHCLSDSILTHNTDCSLPQTIGEYITILRFCSPVSWRRFDTVQPTIARNEVLEKIIDAGNEARILNGYMARTSGCFYRSFDILFPGHGILTFCQHQTVYASEVVRVCDDFARVLISSIDAQYQLILQWSGIYEQVHKEFVHWMDQCTRCLQTLRQMMEDPLLSDYAHVNAVFREWWSECRDEVKNLEELLHDPEVIVPPTIMRVLREICYQVPPGERVQIITKIDEAYHTICTLTTGEVQLADNGQVLAQVEQLSNGPDVDMLLQSLAI